MSIHQGLLQRITHNDPTLCHIDVSGQCLTDYDIEVLCHALRENTHVKAVRIDNTDYSSTISPACAQHLVNLRYVNSIYLRGNDFGAEGYRALSQLPCLRNVFLDAVGANPLFPLGIAYQNLLNPYVFIESEEEWLTIIRSVERRNRQRRDQHISNPLAALEEDVVGAIATEDLELLARIIPQLPQGIMTRLNDNQSPLLLSAIDKNKPQVTKFLLDHGALLEDHERGYNALMTAVGDGRYEIVKFLLLRGASIKGEFNFNLENAISEAAFKLCDAVMLLIGDNESLVDLLPVPLQQQARIFLSQLDSMFQQTPPPWIAMSRDVALFRRLAGIALQLAHNLRRRSQDQALREKLNEVGDRANIYKLIHDKDAILHRTPLLNREQYFYELEGQQYYQIRALTQNAALPTFTQVQVQQLIEQFNHDLVGKNEEQVNWEQYPKFYIAQYRCLHYYQGENHFDEVQRQDHIATCHLNRILPAPAVYSMSSLTPLHHQMARESEMSTNRMRLRNTLDRQRRSGPVALYGRQFANQGDALQHRMSNDYDGYRRDVINRVNAPATELYDQRAIGYPHFATSDLPGHTLRYGYGLKRVQGLVEHTLRADYDQTGKPAHSVLGKILIALFTPIAMYQHQIKHVLGSHNRRSIDLRDTIAPERETSAPGGVTPDCGFYEACLSVPDFTLWREEYVEQYGLNQAQFSDYKQRLNNPNLNTRREIEKDLISKCIIPHIEKQVLRLAQDAARERGGYLIYRHFDGIYGIQPEPIRSSERQPYISQAEQALFREVGPERFAASSMLAAPVSSSRVQVTGQARLHSQIDPDPESANQVQPSSALRRRTR